MLGHVLGAHSLVSFSFQWFDDETHASYLVAVIFDWVLFVRATFSSAKR